MPFATLFFHVCSHLLFTPAGAAREVEERMIRQWCQEAYDAL